MNNQPYEIGSASLYFINKVTDSRGSGLCDYKPFCMSEAGLRNLSKLPHVSLSWTIHFEGVRKLGVREVLSFTQDH